jgi:hypothetical protein
MIVGPWPLAHTHFLPGKKNTKQGKRSHRSLLNGDESVLGA